jgi:DNA-binding TFAR19-related protein (PDSD5 family)
MSAVVWLMQITEEDLIGLLDQISAEETKKKETKIVVGRGVMVD